eukprot:tig00021357_g20801.t1
MPGVAVFPCGAAFTACLPPTNRRRIAGGEPRRPSWLALRPSRAKRAMACRQAAGRRSRPAERVAIAGAPNSGPLFHSLDDRVPGRWSEGAEGGSMDCTAGRRIGGRRPGAHASRAAGCPPAPARPGAVASPAPAPSPRSAPSLSPRPAESLSRILNFRGVPLPRERIFERPAAPAVLRGQRRGSRKLSRRRRGSPGGAEARRAAARLAGRAAARRAARSSPGGARVRRAAAKLGGRGAGAAGGGAARQAGRRRGGRRRGSRGGAEAQRGAEAQQADRTAGAAGGGVARGAPRWRDAASIRDH